MPPLLLLFLGCTGFLFDSICGRRTLMQHNTHSFTLYFHHVLFLPEALLLTFLFIVNTYKSSNSEGTGCVGLMYLLICSNSSLLLDCLYNCKEDDSPVLYLNWMLLVKMFHCCYLKKEKKVMTLLVLLNMQVDIWFLICYVKFIISWSNRNTKIMTVERVCFSMAVTPFTRGTVALGLWIPWQYSHSLSFGALIYRSNSGLWSPLYICWTDLNSKFRCSE